MSTRVRLVGKPGCHLCDQARVTIARVCAELGQPWEELSILEDPVLADLYWEQIPVTLSTSRSCGRRSLSGYPEGHVGTCRPAPGEHHR